jgi:hypothetical protein
MRAEPFETVSRNDKVTPDEGVGPATAQEKRAAWVSHSHQSYERFRGPSRDRQQSHLISE